MNSFLDPRHGWRWAHYLLIVVQRTGTAIGSFFESGTGERASSRGTYDDRRLHRFLCHFCRSSLEHWSKGFRGNQSIDHFFCAGEGEDMCGNDMRMNVTGE